MIGQHRLAGPGGEDLILLFDHAARLTAEDAAGDAPFGEVIEKALKGYLRPLGVSLWAGLRRNHPDLTLEQAHAIVGEAVDAGSLIALQTALLKAVTASMPKKQDAEENPPKAPSGTGTRSSAPGAKRGSTRKPSGDKRPAASR